MKLKPYRSPMFVVYQILTIIAFLAIFSTLLFGVEYMLNLDFDKNPEIPIISMLVMIAFLNIRFFIKYMGNRQLLKITNNEISISSKSNICTLFKMLISEDIFEKKHLIYSHRYGSYKFPVLSIKITSGKSIDIVGMGHTFQWNEETPEIKKADYSIDMNQWNELMRKIGDFLI